jgi:hypothetical protein
VKQKYFTLILLYCILSTKSFAQPVIEGEVTIGGSDADWLSSMYITSDHGLIAAGYSFSDSSGEKTENSRGGVSDYWAVKLNSKGKIEWDKTAGGNDFDVLSSVEQTRDGGYILGGSSRSNISGEKTENSRGLDDYWIVKLDKSGHVEWDKTIGGSFYDNLYALHQTSDGGYILGGSSGSDISGEKKANSRGSDDYWIVKLDSLGNIQWQKTIGGNDIDILTTLQLTNDGGYVLGGWSVSGKSGEKTQNSKGGVDFWIVKLNRSGNIQWDKTIGGSDEDYLQTLQQTKNGGYILGGFSNSNKSADKTQNSRGLFDYWVINLNDKGEIQWDKTIGGNDLDYVSSLQQTMDEGYIVGGQSSSNRSGEKTENTRGFKNRSDYWVVKLDRAGNIQWDKTIGGSNRDELQSVKEIGKGLYLFGGSSHSLVSDDKTKRLWGSYDFWFVKFRYENVNSEKLTQSEDATAVLKNHNLNHNGLKVYPNPVKDILHIETKGRSVICLIDARGNILLTRTFNGSGIINTTNLASGLYYLKNKDTGETQKIVIEE